MNFLLPHKPQPHHMFEGSKTGAIWMWALFCIDSPRPELLSLTPCWKQREQKFLWWDHQSCVGQDAATPTSTPAATTAPAGDTRGDTWGETPGGIPGRTPGEGHLGLLLFFYGMSFSNNSSSFNGILITCFITEQQQLLSSHSKSSFISFSL